MKKEEFSVSMGILKFLVAATFVSTVISYFVGYSIRSILPIGLIDVLAGLGLLVLCLVLLMIAALLIFIVGMKKGRAW